MKCILKHGATLVERVSDEEAHRLVTDGKAQYKPKWMLKRQPKSGHYLEGTHLDVDKEEQP